jgi:hypothetical protein
LLLAKIITTNTLGSHRIQRLTLNQPLIAPNSCKNPHGTTSKGCPALGIKAPLAISPFLFLFLFLSQQEEDRPSIRIKLCDILEPYSMESLPTPHHTGKKVVPFFPPRAGSKAVCIKLQNKQTGEHYTPCATPLPTPGEHKPAQPLGRLNHPLSPHSKTEKT